MTIHKSAFAAVALAVAVGVAAMLFVDPANAVSTSGPVFRNDATARTLTQPAEAAPMADSTPPAVPVATDNTKKAPVEAAPAATKPAAAAATATGNKTMKSPVEAAPAAATAAAKPMDATAPVPDKKVMKAPAEVAPAANVSSATARATAGSGTKHKKLKSLRKTKKHHHMRKYKRSAVANGARSETSRACSIKANVLHLHGKARKVFRHKCLKKAA